MGRLQGQHDVPLNPLGRDQSTAAGRVLGALLAGRGVQPRGLRFTASPLARARDTMERVRAVLGLDAVGYGVDDSLRELSFGAWEGLTWPEIKARDLARFRERRRDKWHFVPPGGESYADLAERLGPWLAGVRPHDVVVAHGGVARALMHLLAAVSQGDAPEVDILQGRVLCFREGRCFWA